ncbi:MAG: hypothetical protein JWR77_2697 [Rhizorhabdus sp.]|nr:hypothetical protein [Rhizorhabdus sp.]
MKRETDGGRLLNSLLDAEERSRDRTRRIIQRPSVGFASAAEHQSLNEILLAARDAGAIHIHFDREAPHLIDRVVLVDPPRLYTHLGRQPVQIGREAALTSLGGFSAVTEIGRDLVTYIQDQWRSGKSALALSPDDLEEAIRLARAADAAFTELPGGRVPLRTRSARLLGDSKALERSLPKLISFLKTTGRIDPTLERKDAARLLGLEKFPQPLLLAGPLRIGDLSISDWPYVGLPAELGESLNIVGTVRSILTIENLESFNRHVRECRQPGDIVVYTGGFPAAGVIATLNKMITLSGVRNLWHWGDIDAGGIGIVRYLERMLPIPVHPHLMTAELAATFGKPASSPMRLPDIPAESALASLATYLMRPDAKCLEQEVIDPEPVDSLPAR